MYRSLNTKGKQRILPKGGNFGFFGWHLVSVPPALATNNRSGSNSDDGINNSVNKGQDKIIITEGEYDAIAIAQALRDYNHSTNTHPQINSNVNNVNNVNSSNSKVSTNWIKSVPVVSLPNGCNSFPVELISLLERFKVIYLWLDNDSSGIAAAEKFSRKLGIHRCQIIKPLDNCQIQPKDANDALRAIQPSILNNSENIDENEVNYNMNVNMMVNMLLLSQSIKHDRIVSFTDLKQEVLLQYVIA